MYIHVKVHKTVLIIIDSRRHVTCTLKIVCAHVQVHTNVHV